MRQINNITDQNFQRHTILFEESQIILQLQYYTMLQQWFFNVEYNDFILTGKHLAINTYHLISSNQPFDFIAVDTSQKGIDPFRIDDFSLGRIALLLLEPDDLQAIRGARVPL